MRISPSRVKIQLRKFKNTPFAQNLGIKIVKLKPGYAELSLDYQKRITQPYGFMHGGAIAALSDTVAATAIHILLGVKVKMGAWFITFLILIAIPFSQALGEKEDSTLLFMQGLGFVKLQSINKDNFPVEDLEQKSKSPKRGIFRGVATFRFGRHDNFTKSSSTTYSY